MIRVDQRCQSANYRQEPETIHPGRIRRIGRILSHACDDPVNQRRDTRQAEDEQPVDELNVHVRPKNEQHRQPPRQPILAAGAEIQDHVECERGEQDREHPRPLFEQRRQGQNGSGGQSGGREETRLAPGYQTMDGSNDRERQDRLKDHRPSQAERPLQAVEQHLEEPAVRYPRLRRGFKSCTAGILAGLCRQECRRYEVWKSCTAGILAGLCRQECRRYEVLKPRLILSIRRERIVLRHRSVVDDPLASAQVPP